MATDHRLRRPPRSHPTNDYHPTDIDIPVSVCACASDSVVFFCSHHRHGHRRPRSILVLLLHQPTSRPVLLRPPPDERSRWPIHSPSQPIPLPSTSRCVVFGVSLFILLRLSAHFLFLTTDPPRPNPHFRSTDDLLSRFHLLPAYDRYVRPYSSPVSLLPSTSSFSSDKGKGKERELPQKDPATPAALPPQSQGPANDADDDDGVAKGEKKWKNNYRHLIKGIPGASSFSHTRSLSYNPSLSLLPQANTL